MPAESRQAGAPVSADPIAEQPADLLPFVGGEHADTLKGIAFTLPDYLQLVGWTGRAVRDDKRGAIPAHIQRNGWRSSRTSGGAMAWRRARWIGSGLSASNWGATGFGASVQAGDCMSESAIRQAVVRGPGKQ